MIYNKVSVATVNDSELKSYVIKIGAMMFGK